MSGKMRLFRALQMLLLIVLASPCFGQALPDGSKPIRIWLDHDNENKPVGIYVKQVRAAIMSKLSFLAKQHPEWNAPGVVKLASLIDREGRVSHVQLTGSTSNDEFVTVCKKSIEEADIPAPPQVMLDEMRNQKLLHEMAFGLTSR